MTISTGTDMSETIIKIKSSNVPTNKTNPQMWYESKLKFIKSWKTVKHLIK